ncbi:MAG: Hpt domain-containing protein [Clostridium sp.]
MDTSQYLDLFIDETKEHLQSLNEHVLVLEKEPENEDTINEIFRAAHTLKGMSGTMGFVRMQRLTHDLENVFSEIRNGNMKVNEKLIDVLFRGLDALESYLAVISSEGNEGTEDNEDIINDLNALLEEQSGDVALLRRKRGKKEETPAKEEKAENKQESASDENANLSRFRFPNMKRQQSIQQEQKERTCMELPYICKKLVF